MLVDELSEGDLVPVLVREVLESDAWPAQLGALRADGESADFVVRVAPLVRQPKQRDPRVVEPLVDNVLGRKVDLLAHGRDHGQCGSLDVRGSKGGAVLVVFVGTGEVVDVRLGDVGTERALRVLERDGDRAVVGALDEVGVFSLVVPNLPEIVMPRTVRTSISADAELPVVARRERVEDAAGTAPSAEAIALGLIPSLDSACASWTTCFTGRAPRCGTTRCGSASHTSHTASGTLAFGRSSRPSSSTFCPMPGIDSMIPVRNFTTLPAVVRSKNGRMQSTELSRSSPGTRRASGLRTIRPSSCVMCVWSCAWPERHEHLGPRAVPPGRNGVLRNQHPYARRLLYALWLDPFDLPRAERSVSCGRRARAESGQVRFPSSDATVSSHRPTSSGSSVFGACRTSSG